MLFLDIVVFHFVGTKGVVTKLESDYVGCYYDDRNRLLKHRGKVLQDNSIENCRKHCKGFKYIGLQVFIIYIH